MTEDRLANTKKALLDNFNVLSNPPNKTAMEDASIKVSHLLEGSNGIQLILSKEVLPYLQQGLQHSNAQVIRLTLNQIAKCAEDASTLPHLDDDRLFHLLVSLIESDDLSVSEATIRVFEKLCKHDEGRSIFFHSSIITQLKKMLLDTVPEKTRFRVLGLIASISSLSPQNFYRCRDNGFLEDILSTLNTPDVLQWLIVVELLEKLGNSEEIVGYLDESGALKKLNDMLTEGLQSKDPFFSYVIPRIFIFFGVLASGGEKQLQIVSQYNVQKHLHTQLEEGSRELKEACITSQGFLGSTPAGFLFLQQEGLLEDLSTTIGNELLLRQASFHSLGHILDSLSKYNDGKVEAMLSTFAKNLPHRTRANEKTTLYEIVVPIVTGQPFEELRIAAFQTIKGLANFGWGSDELVNFPGFFEWLMNRNSENTKEGKEQKFEIVRRLLRTLEKRVRENQPRGALDVARAAELNRYIRNGPFFVDAEAAVFVESKTQ
ncbi:hypothetical protein PROFUN_08935 [Planoprotostelium fungivorum]|uniref:26S proteasome non-ATPase regulatory subunit 5 n=1 Tax=Planoprotostelium fungivorum TaxID=1890364 RepID=A0A2P6NIN6_9EUKA|nr:hypothetical protein PROFUN_08935 [Planoprotostelium fungivorum]